MNTDTNTNAMTTKYFVKATVTPRVGVLNEDALVYSWMSFLRRKSDRTRETYLKGVHQFFIYLSAKGITQPVKENIIDFIEYLEPEHKPATINLYLTSLKRFFAWLEESDIYPNIAANVEGVKLDSEHKKDALTQSQARELLQVPNRATLKGKRDFAIIGLMLTTGVRDVEVVRANIEDMRTVGNDTMLFVQGKGHHEKGSAVKIAPEIEKAIREYLACRGKTDGTDPLFISVANRNLNERLTTRSVSRMIKESLKSIGLDSERITSHSLRHTAITNILLTGGTLTEAQMVARHKSIETTMIYQHVIDRANNNAELRVASMLFG